MDVLSCICGEPVTNKPYCSERCKYIIIGMSTPMGLNMSQQRAIRFFGARYDKEQREGKTK